MKTNQRCSTRVARTLLVTGLQLPLSHVGNSGLMIAEPCEPIPASEAGLVVSIDDEKEEHLIYLADGVSEPGEFVQFL